MSDQDLVIIAPLYNFNCESTIKLSPNAEIKETTKTDSIVIQKFLSLRKDEHKAMSKYSIYIYNQKIEEDDLSKAKHIIEKYVLLLRIFRKGNIYFNFLFIDKNNNIIDREALFYTQQLNYYTGWSHKGLIHIYSLSDKDDDELQLFIKSYESLDLMNQRAFRSFFRSFHEPLSDDRFLDNVISLENILCNDSNDNSNIRYKFIDRGIFLLHQINEKITVDEYKAKLSKIYDMRCNIVHSSKKIQNWIGEKYDDLLYNSDDFARKLLQYKLKNQSITESNKIDDLKRGLY